MRDHDAKVLHRTFSWFVFLEHVLMFCVLLFSIHVHLLIFGIFMRFDDSKIFPTWFFKQI